MPTASLSTASCSLSLQDDTLKYVSPFYLISMPEDVKVPTHGVNGKMCNITWPPHSSLEMDTSLNHSCVSPSMGCLEYS